MITYEEDMITFGEDMITKAELMTPDTVLVITVQNGNFRWILIVQPMEMTEST